MCSILLVDNGSRRPEATLRLRRIAAALGQRIGRQVAPVSLLHASTIPAASLNGRIAETFESFLRRHSAEGHRRFIVVPLFFGPSRALTEFIPERIRAVAADSGPLDVRVADALCPLPSGEQRLVDILIDNAAAAGTRCDHVVLVDHGSPLPAVTAVRSWLAEQMAARLGTNALLSEAVMERRTGARYDFNGPLLEEALLDLASRSPSARVNLAMQFILPGRHAGPEGDVAQICATVMAKCSGFQVRQSPLVGDHPGLIDILQSRVFSAIEAADVKDH